MSADPVTDAFVAVCDRLTGFDARMSPEWADGYFTALLCGARVVMPGEWMPKMFGDAFERAFADPDDVEQALQALTGRWNTIAEQLLAQTLLEDEDTLHLQPLMWEWRSDNDAPVPALGAVWAAGFIDAVNDFADDWPEIDPATEDGAYFDDRFMRIAALTFDDEDMREHAERFFAGRTPTRDELVDEACFAVQDLRLYWLEKALTPAPRRVDKTPGRNDPCPCGSGRKFKKCHGAQ